MNWLSSLPFHHSDGAFHRNYKVEAIRGKNVPKTYFVWNNGFIQLHFSFCQQRISPVGERSGRSSFLDNHIAGSRSSTGECDQWVWTYLCLVR
jgi:hypothetical protein